jgi:hypothetical protein
MTDLLEVSAKHGLALPGQFDLHRGSNIAASIDSG